MRLELEYEGAIGKIYVAVLPGGESPARNFLELLKRDHLDSHKVMVRRYRRHADNGPSLNKQHSRPIQGRSRSGLFEFKTDQGDRLLYFYRPGGVTVLTNGFHKGDPPEREYDRAVRYRTAGLAEEESNDDQQRRRRQRRPRNTT